MSQNAPTVPASDARFIALTVVGGLLVGAYYLSQLWTFDATGFSIMSDRLVYWDFTNLWAGSKLAWLGKAGTLFDVEAYRAALRAMFALPLPDQEWSYPPNILMLGVPLAQLPIFAAYLIWTMGTVAALGIAVRPLRLPRLALAAVLLSPAVVINAMFGQNGSLTAALLIGGLLAAPARPVVAGILFGLLTIKPHLGILVPFCLLASGNWRAIIASAVTAAAMAILTGVFFGFDVWRLFFTETATLMRAILEAPYPQLYHANAMTVFILARAAGAGLALAYLVQAIAALAAIGAAVWLWLPSTRVAPGLRAATTAVLALVATPYGYTYDAVPLSVLIAVLVTAPRRPPIVFLAIAWLFPLVAHMPNFSGVGATVLVPVALACWVLVDTVRLNRRATFAGDLTLKAS